MNVRDTVLATIWTRQQEYARCFDGCPWTADQLSDHAWLAMVAVPWLLNEVEQNGKNGDAQSDPRAESIRLAQAAVELMQSQQPVTPARPLIVSGNPLAKGFITHLAKLVGVSFHVGDATKPAPAKKAEVAA